MTNHYKFLSIELNKDTGFGKAGTRHNVGVDENNIPVRLFWRRLFKDAALDNCLTILDDNKPSSEQKNKKESDKNKG